MSDFSRIEELFKGTFKVLNGLPRYIALEENEVQQALDFKEKIADLVEYGQNNRLKHISILIQRSSANFNELSEVLLIHGFKHTSSIMEFTKELRSIDKYPSFFQWRSLKEAELSEYEFMRTWEQCMLFSDNLSSTLTIEQHLNSVKSELGADWKNSCRVFIKKGNPIGTTIPHIEPGTADEGRLFYFGIIPEERGKGLSSILHLQSLSFLKEMGAAYYIGSTHEANIKMQNVFKKNDCSFKSHKESYYKYFS